MKKVLIITYYWPPKGGAGVQRWLKMVKYFRENNWEPIIFTPSEGDTPVTDETLQKDVPKNTTELNYPIWEPFDLYNKILGNKGGKKNYSGLITEGKKGGKIAKLSMWIRGNFFIPDARKFWIKPATNYILDYLVNNPVDAIISTGPPHSMHLVALNIKEKLNIPWVADFRDPWTKIDFYHELRLSNWANKKHHQLEKEVLTKANKVVCVSPSWAKDFEVLGDRKIEVITNGFDPEDYQKNIITLDSKFTITHVGSMNKDRNPYILWEAISELINKSEEFKAAIQIQLIGQVDFSILKTIEENNLNDYVLKINHLPHKQAIEKLETSQILLLPINDTPNINGVVPGKLFEYMGAKRPILCIGKKDADAGIIIQKANAGSVFNFNEKEQLVQQLNIWFELFKSKSLNIQAQNINIYSRKELAKDYTELLNTIC